MITVWLDTATTAHLLGHSQATVRRLCEEGAFPGAYQLGVGGHWRIPQQDVQAFLDACRGRSEGVG